MKSSRQTISRMAGVAALCALAGLTPLANGGLLDILKGEPVVEWQRIAFVGSANVERVQGKVERKVGEEKWDVLLNGARLSPGEVIRTQPGSSVVLRMVESGSLVKVTPGTVLRLADLEEEWDSAALTGKEEERGFSVRGLRGKAFFRERGGKWQRIEVNTVLAPATIVRTSENAELDLYDTRQGRFVRILGESQAELSESITLTRRYSAPAVAVTDASGAER